ncbi:MAG TPA: hypothetical protein VIG08_09510 [Gemmatimonadales bacterium]|jgi:hypothetical protein
MMPLFDYYMVRVTRTEEPAQLAGLIERLGTGEKRSFSSGEQLLGLVAGWAGPESNLQVPLGSGNPAD